MPGAAQVLKNADIREGGLRAKFDAIILTSQSTELLLHGTRDGEAGRSRSQGSSGGGGMQRSEYTGGIGLAELSALDDFARSGGTLITFDAATELPRRVLPSVLAAQAAVPRGRK